MVDCMADLVVLRTIKTVIVHDVLSGEGKWWGFVQGAKIYGELTVLRDLQLQMVTISCN